MEKSKSELFQDDQPVTERLSGTEKLLRDVNGIADQFYSLVKLIRYPITRNGKHYKMIIYGPDKGEWCKLFQESAMEFETVLKYIKKDLDDYKMKNKEYSLRKPGGGELM